MALLLLMPEWQRPRSRAAGPDDVDVWPVMRASGWTSQLLACRANRPLLATPCRPPSFAGPRLDRRDTPLPSLPRVMKAAPIAVSINARVKTPPVEMADGGGLGGVHHRQDRPRRGADASRYQEDAGTAMVCRAHRPPAGFVDSGNARVGARAGRRAARRGAQRHRPPAVPQAPAPSTGAASSSRAPTLADAAPPPEARPRRARRAKEVLAATARPGRAAWVPTVSSRSLARSSIAATVPARSTARSRCTACASSRARRAWTPRGTRRACTCCCRRWRRKRRRCGTPRSARCVAGCSPRATSSPTRRARRGRARAARRRRRGHAGAGRRAQRAIDVASAAGQSRLAVEPLDALDGTAMARCLAELGLPPTRRRPACPACHRRRRGTGGRAECHRIAGALPLAADPVEGPREEGASAGEDELRISLNPDEASDAATDDAPGVDDAPADADAGARGDRLWSAEDIERLKRMFGEPL